MSLDREIPFVSLGEPNPKYVNTLYPVVDGFPALLPGYNRNPNATVSQQLRAPAALVTILWFEA